MKQKMFLLLLSVMTFFVFTGCGAEEVKPVNTEGDEVVNENEDDTGGEDIVTENPVEKLETNVSVDAKENDATFTISLKNTSEDSVNVTFTSGQRFELVVTDAANNEVYRYSIDKSFIQSIEEMELKAGEEKTWQENWDYSSNSGERLPGGEYKVTAIVVASQVNGEKLTNNVLQAEASTITIPDANSAFRHVKAMGENGEYIVTGEARVFEGSFFYSVEDGHDYVIDETAQMADAGAPAWSPFEIKVSIPKEKLPTNGALIFHLFERSAKDGSIVNSYFLTLQQFQ